MAAPYGGRHFEKNLFSQPELFFLITNGNPLWRPPFRELVQSREMDQISLQHLGGATQVMVLAAWYVSGAALKESP